MILMIMTVKTPQNHQSHCQVLRLFKGAYRRRCFSGPAPQVICPQSPLPPSRRRTGRHPLLGRRLFVACIAAHVHCAGSTPMKPTAARNSVTPRAQGFVRLCSKKNAFQRAQRQTLATGSAVYRGRHMTPKPLGVVWTSMRPSQPRRAKPSTPPKPKIRVVTWNSGGLNLARQTVIRTWLETESRVVLM